MATDAARGLAFLHGRRPVIVHRDVKSPNVLLSDDWCDGWAFDRPGSPVAREHPSQCSTTLAHRIAKVGDFGLSDKAASIKKLRAGATAEPDVSPLW